ncbi:hypothetical protein FRC07_006236 [Ceratobasidium sp. 392]|nr:hypothetical protein FRC07_006236 [Ceratobasidium sp. 392]
MGEIDDIFAGKSKSKGKAKEVEDNPPKDLVSSKNKKKKKKKKRKVDAEEPPAEPTEVAPVAGEKRKLPETVVDPSLAVEPKAKKNKAGKKDKDNVATRAENSDDERFKDSRGTGPRRRTEEGYAIYKEDELGIGMEGGVGLNL